MRLFRPGIFAGWLYPDAIFRINTTEKVLYLTFDDGPDPESTPLLLDILGTHSIKALFFCTGEAAEKYPVLVERIISDGHVTGNHTYSHCNGWRTSAKRYISDVKDAEKFTSSVLFRPPYGGLSLRQYRRLKETYKIIFWDIMPYDFDLAFGWQNSLQVLKKRIRPGSIIALHDSSNSAVNKILDEFITLSIDKGYRFEIPRF